MTNTELSLEQLQDISGGFSILALFGGCDTEKDDKKDNKSDNKKVGKKTTWLDIGSSAAICGSGSKHEHPLYPNANCPDNTNQK